MWLWERTETCRGGSNLGANDTLWCRAVSVVLYHTTKSVASLKVYQEAHVSTADRIAPPKPKHLFGRMWRHVTDAASEVAHLVRLAIPIVIGLASSTLISVVDTVMIAPLGTFRLAATSITVSILLIFYSGLYGVTSVAGVLVARHYGAKDFDRVSTDIASGLALSVLSGLVAAVVMIGLLPLLERIGQPAEIVEVVTPYWIAMAVSLIPYSTFHALKGLYDGIDKPWTGVLFSFLGVGVNIPTNYLLIHGVGPWDGMGLLGAGVASLISLCVSFGVALVHWRYAASMTQTRQQVWMKRSNIRFQLREGVSLAIGYIANGGAYALTGLMLGWFGASALAAHQVVNSVSSVLYMLPLGMSAAVAIRIGQTVGADESGRLGSIASAAIGAVVIWMGLVTLGVLLAGPTIANALSDAPEVVSIATTMFVVLAGMQIVDGVQTTGFGMLRGILDNRWSVAVTLVGFWLVALPTAYIVGFVLRMGPSGVWLGYGLGLLPVAIALPVRFARLTRESRSRVPVQSS